jgi:hypothetical protein
MQRRYAESNAWFDKSEDMLRYYATDNAGVARAVAAAAVNDNVIPLQRKHLRRNHGQYL